MSKNVAIKKLSKSDLTIFKWHFLNHNAGNQKSINLNANIFIDIFFPKLPEIAQSLGNRIALNLDIYGPGIFDCLNIQRKIIKGATYKNWRLNGEFIDNPIDQPERFNKLSPGDFVIIDFTGIEKPTSAKLFFIAKNETEDSDLHNQIVKITEGKSMMALSIDNLTKILDQSSLAENHPMRIFNIDEELENIALGGNIEYRKLASPSFIKISSLDLKRAKDSAESNGLKGEEFTWEYLKQLEQKNKLVNPKWVSIENAVSPYDFSIEVDNNTILIDSKSTTGPFSRKIYISINELRQIAYAEEPYYIYRVYDMKEKTAKLRIISDLRDLANQILQNFGQLPKCVKTENVSLNPGMLTYGEEIQIVFEDDIE